MSGLALGLALVNAALLLWLPRRWAHFPLLLGTLYTTSGQVVSLGPLHFTVVRLLIAAGFVRVLMKGERIAGGVCSLDRAMIGWGAFAVFSSLFHTSFASALVSHLGLVYDALGAYWLMRVFIRSTDDFLLVARSLLLLLAPLAMEMILEKSTGRNLFALLGGLEKPEVRAGRVRAQGPFGHAILAGTAGAVCLPLAVLYWRRHRGLAVLGLAATASIVVASASSGPILTAVATVGTLGMWKVRHYLRSIRWVCILGLLALSLVMNSPVYYLMARIDVVGGSTGWHRAALIDSALAHLNEWWLAGTDYTRHWMPTGIAANDYHTDITNHYLYMGITGGLVLMLLFIWVLRAAFVAVRRALQQNEEAPLEQQFIIWSLGCMLFGHAITFMTILYFDQNIVLLYGLLASIGSLQAMFPASVPAQARVATSSPAEWGLGCSETGHRLCG